MLLYVRINIKVFFLLLSGFTSPPFSLLLARGQVQGNYDQNTIRLVFLVLLQVLLYFLKRPNHRCATVSHLIPSSIIWLGGNTKYIKNTYNKNNKKSIGRFNQICSLKKKKIIYVFLDFLLLLPITRGREKQQVIKVAAAENKKSTEGLGTINAQFLL